MILASARREILLQWRDGRIGAVSLALAAACLATLFMGWFSYQDYQHDYGHFTQEIRDQWVGQGQRHPHRAAHYGVYVSKPASPLSVLEPGLAPATGQAIWLNAHDRTTYSNPPAHDDIVAYTVMSMASPAAIVTVLGGLFALTLGALGIVREREDGVLRQIIAQGGRGNNWALGKLVGLSCVVAAPFLPILSLAGLFLIVSAEPSLRLDTAMRVAGFLAVNTGFLLAMLCVGLIVSCLAKTARSALLIAFSVWIAVFIIAPRGTSAWIEAVHPTVDWEAFQAEITATFNAGYGDRPGYGDQLAALERETMAAYGVTRLEDLPVGFSGIRMMHMSDWSSEVSDRAYGEMRALWNRQSRLRTLASLVFPYLAVRSASQNMAGADWSHFRAFSEAAEGHRRNIVRQLDEVIKDELRGDVWEMDSDASLWSRTEPFAYQSPHAVWALTQSWPAFLVVLLWAAAGVLVLRHTAGRLAP